MSKMSRRINEKIKRESTVDDLQFLKEFDENEEKKNSNTRLIQQEMLQELKNLEIEELEDSLLIPPMPPPQFPPSLSPFFPYPYITALFPPQIIIPPKNNNNNQASDSTAELVKFLLIKKLLDKDDNKPLYPYQMNYYTFNPIPYWYYPPYYKIKKPKKKFNLFSYPKPIIIKSSPPPKEQKNKKKRKTTKTESSNSQKEISFIDPLDNYLKSLNNYKKHVSNSSNQKSISKEEKSEEN